MCEHDHQEGQYCGEEESYMLDHEDDEAVFLPRLAELMQQPESWLDPWD